MSCFYSEFEYKGINRKENKNKIFFVLGNGFTMKEFIGDYGYILDRENVVTIGTNVIELIYQPDYLAFHYSSIKRSGLTNITNPSKTIGVCKDWPQETFAGRKLYKDNLITVRTSSATFSGFNIDKDGRVDYPGLLIGTFALNVAILFGGIKIFVAGMDGYEKKPGKFGGPRSHFYKPGRQTGGVQLNQHVVKCLQPMNNWLKSQGGYLYLVTETKYKQFYNKNWKELIGV